MNENCSFRLMARNLITGEDELLHYKRRKMHLKLSFVALAVVSVIVLLDSAEGAPSHRASYKFLMRQKRSCYEFEPCNVPEDCVPCPNARICEWVLPISTTTKVCIDDPEQPGGDDKRKMHLKLSFVALAVVSVIVLLDSAEGNPSHRALHKFLMRQKRECYDLMPCTPVPPATSDECAVCNKVCFFLPLFGEHRCIDDPDNPGGSGTKAMLRHLQGADTVSSRDAAIYFADYLDRNFAIGSSVLCLFILYASICSSVGALCSICMELYVR
eukprot:gene5695-6396_t